MAAVIMSNPGLHMAVLGNPHRAKKRKGKKKMATKRQMAALRKARAAKKSKYRTSMRKRAGRGVKIVYRRKAGKRKTNHKFGKKRNIKTGRKGKIAYYIGKRKVATNPKRRKSRSKKRKSSRKSLGRRNPAISLKGYTTGFTSAPSQIMKTFSGKNVIKNTGFLAAGTVAAYVAGGFIGKAVAPVINMVPGAAGVMQKPLVAKIVNASMSYSAGFLISQLVKDPDMKKAIRLGGALAAIVSAIKPDLIGGLMTSIPGVGKSAVVVEAAETGAEGISGYFGTELAGFMGEYVDASAYQGAGEYVDASAYQGAGEYVDASAYQGAGDDDALAEYVDASAYQGAGDDDALAGSFLDESNMFQSYI